MMEHAQKPDGTDAQKAAALREDLRRLDEVSREQIMASARAEGWPEEEAGMMDILAKQSLVQDVVAGRPVAEALREAYGRARRQLILRAYGQALAAGQDAAGAFRAVIGLEASLAERRGETLPAYAPEVAQAGCAAALQAAAEGRSEEEQMLAGSTALLARLEQGGAPLH